MLLADLSVAAAAAAGPAGMKAVFAAAAAAVVAAAVTSHQAAVVTAGHRDWAVTGMQQNSVVPAGCSCQPAVVLPLGTAAVTGTAPAAAPVVAAVTHSWAGGQGAGLGAAACHVPPGHFAALGPRAAQSSAGQQYCT